MSMKIEACYEVEYKDKSVDIWNLESIVSDDADVDETLDQMFDNKCYYESSNSEAIDKVWLLSISVNGKSTYVID
jgi:hypothetical protein